MDVESADYAGHGESAPASTAGLRAKARRLHELAMSISRRTFIKAFAVLTAWLSMPARALAHHKPGHNGPPSPEPQSRSGLLLLMQSFTIVYPLVAVTFTGPAVHNTFSVDIS